MAETNIFCATLGTLSTKLINNMLYSLSHSTYQDFKVHIAASDQGRFKTDIDPIYEKLNIEYHSFQEKKHFPELIKHMYSYVDEDCKYVVIANDDVMVHKECIATMINTINATDEYPMVLEPLSNCDNGRLYWHPIVFRKDAEMFTLLKGEYEFDEVEPYKEQIVTWDYPYKMPGIQFATWVAFYFAMMKRNTYEAAGGIDPIFKTGKDDLEFCERASRLLNAKSAICTDAFVFHYAGATSKTVITQEDRDFNEAHYNNIKV